MDYKNESKHLEAVKSSGDITPTEPIDHVESVEYDPSEEKKLIRRIDRRLLPILGCLYAIAAVDRVNISAARISGMDADLGLSIGNRYTLVLIMFFPPYMAFELPSNIVLRKVGVGNWLSFIAFSWGTVMMGQAWAKDYRVLMVLRFFLGAFEAGFFPGCLYLISVWYVRFEVQQRLAWFYLCSIFIGAFSSIFAYALIQMDGLGNTSGWQWIFIIEGIITQVFAIGAWFLIVDFPDKAAMRGKFAFMKPLLSQKEANFVLSRIEKDRGDSIPDPLTWKKFGMHIRDWKLWVFGLMFMSVAMPSYALAYFGPSIVLSMGYSVGITHVLGTPPVVAAVIFGLTTAYFSDKYRVRAPAIILQCMIGIAGLMMVAYCENNAPRYAGLFFGWIGASANTPAILAYQANNIRGQSKRAVGSAVQIGMGGMGGIIGSTVFRQQDAPLYRPGLWATAGLQFLILSLTAMCTVIFHFENKKADRGTRRKPIGGQEGFRYTL